MERVLSAGLGIAAAAAALMIGAAGCGRSAPSAAEEAPPPLAKVGDVPITEEDVQFEIERRVATGRPLGDAESILQDLVERQAMLQAAAQSELLEDPVVRRELENRKLGQWLDRSLQVERDAVRVSDEELQTYYSDNIESFTRGGMVRLAMLYRRQQTLDRAEGIEELRDALEEARATFLSNPEAQTQQGRLLGFGSLAAETSEDTVTRYRGGDLGWMEFDALTNRIPAAVAEAGMALSPGSVSDVLIADNELFVVMKIDERPPQVTPFEEVAPTLRRRLIRMKQEEVDRTFMSNLLAGTRVEIDRERVASIPLPEAARPDPPALRPMPELRPSP